jgi:bacterioferritin
MHHNVVELLNKDLEGEHAAIIQYLVHAYSMGEGEMACEIEAIAREEMRHLDWLAETIVSLGGTLSITRGEMRSGGDSVSTWMRNDVLQEEDAIAMYEEHIKSIEDPKIKRLLERILSDEKSHRGDFEHFTEKSERKGMKDVRGNREDALTRNLDWGIEHEYTVVLQYLFHSYMSPDPDVKREMEDQAINEMQHIGWLAEAMIDEGGNPRIEHTEVDRSTEGADMLKADIKIEREVTAKYTEMSKEIEDEKLRDLIVRIRDHEIYHNKVFSDLLEKGEPRE